MVNALSVLPAELSEPNWDAVGLGGAALLICLLMPKRLSRVVPAPLVALFVTSALAVFFDTASTIGEMPSGLPEWTIPTFRFE